MMHRYLFVGGLHRSGTSLLARLAGRLPGVGAITGAPVPEGEGVYLQGAIPHTARHGRPGAFAFDPAAHLVEGGVFDRLEVRDRLAADWASWFPPDAPWRIEKSPVNMLRTRLYQQLFPLSQFVLVVRHPFAVARATAKWSDSPESRLLEHWGRAHALALDDMDWLHSGLVLRYEDIVAEPVRMLTALALFLDLDGPRGAAISSLHGETVRDGNADYPMEKGESVIGAETAAAMAALGYGPDGTVSAPEIPRVRHPLRRVHEAVEAALAAE